MKKLFIHSMTNLLTADEVYSLFQPKLSPEGSNRREFEEQAIMYWLQYLQTIESACKTYIVCCCMAVTIPSPNITY